MRHAKLYKRLTVALVLFLGLLVVGDVVALQVAESRAAAGLAQATAAERASVDLGSFPFLPGLLTGKLARVEVRATGLSGAGLRVARLEARVTDVRFSVSGALAVVRSPHARRTKVTALNPFGRAEVEQGDLEAFVKRKEPSVHDLRILDSGIEVRFELEPGVVSPPARFFPRIERRRLVLTLVGFAGARGELLERARLIERSVELPPIPEGLSVEIRLGSGVFTVEASGSRVSLLVGEGGLRSA